MRLLAGLAIGALLYFAHTVFIPIALAVLLSLLLTSPVEALHRRGLPRSASAIVVLAVLASLIGGSVNLPWTPTQSWWASAPKTLMTIENRSRPVWLGGWFWGVAGIVMAVPTLLSLKVMAQHSRLGGPLTEFLSPEETTLAPVAAVMAQYTSQTRYPNDRDRLRPWKSA